MITNLVVNDSLLEIGRIDRKHIDIYAAKYPLPTPPLKSAAELGLAVFGGEKEAEKELVEVWDDPDYLKALQDYTLGFYDRQLELVMPALTFQVPTDQNLSDLIALGTISHNPSRTDLLRFVILQNHTDAIQVVESVLYNSTVTNLGMLEAAMRFNVCWQGSLVPVNVPDNSPLSSTREYADRCAAIRHGYNWTEFCQLTGPEQSAIVALDRINMRLAWIRQKQWK